MVNRDPGPRGTEMWDAAYRSLLEGQRQAQEYWSNAARSWGEMAGSLFSARSGENSGRIEEGLDLLRELNEATMAVAMAWMRLPLILVGNADRSELQDAVSRLTQAQGRAFQLWIDSLNRMGEQAVGTLRQAEAGAAGAATGAARGAASGAEKAAESEQRRAAASKAGRASGAARTRKSSNARSTRKTATSSTRSSRGRKSPARKPSSSS